MNDNDDLREAVLTSGQLVFVCIVLLILIAGCSYLLFNQPDVLEGALHLGRYN